MGIFRRKPVLENYKMPSDVLPRCSHCEEEVDGLMAREIVTELGKAFVWACPLCHTILSVSHRQGYIAAR